MTRGRIITFLAIPLLALAGITAIFMSNALFAPGTPANPRVIIKKAARSLELYDGEKLVRSYKVALGPEPFGHKAVEGDGRTPEGDLYVVVKNPESKYHLSLGLNYPGPGDAERGLAAGLLDRTEYDQVIDAAAKRQMPPQKTKLGGEIYIHGGGTATDWTLGCVAMANDDIEEIFAAVAIGTPVSIRP